MKPLTLKKALRGDQKRAIREVIDLVGGQIRVEDAAGKLLVGSPEATGTHRDLSRSGVVIGRVIGGDGGDSVARFAGWIYDKELEKRALANETLGRYKELSLLYEMGNTLSRELDVADVAKAVVEGAQRHLKATGAALLLHDAGKNLLEVAGWVGDPRDNVALPADQGLAGEVLSTGRAVFVDETVGSTPTSSLDEVPTSQICAPLRIGDRVFGVLRMRLDGTQVWTSGDLKLVSALAAHASSALSAAQLHARQVNQLALLHQLERHVSDDLLKVAYNDAIPDNDTLTVACCDLRGLGALPDSGRNEPLADVIEGGVARAMCAFLQGGGTVDTPQSGVVLGVFRGSDATVSAMKAGQSAIESVRRWAPTGLGVQSPGVGVAMASVSGTNPAGLFRGINIAAVLQSESYGRLLVSQDVADTLGDNVALTSIGARELPGGAALVYEVQL